MIPVRSRHLASVLLVCASIAAATESVILTPSITLGTGMAGNRFQTADEEQSEAFLEVSPVLSVSWFATERTEYELGTSFTQRNFPSDAGEQQSPSLLAGIQYHLGNLQAVATTSGGTFTDSQLPEDDSLWVQAALAVGLNLHAGQQIYVRTYVQSRDYESRLTLAGEDQAADTSGITVGYFRPLASSVTLWAELQQSSMDSNEPLDTAESIAVAAGGGYRVSASSTLELSFRFANATEPDNEGIDTDTQPLTFAFSYTQRFTDWCSWQSSARWEQFADDGELYDEWTVATGITFATDL